MRGRREERIEAAIDQTAAAVFAAAVAFVVIVAMREALPLPRLGAGALLFGALAYEACAGALRRVPAGGEAFSSSSFDLPDLEFEEELLLTEQAKLLFTEEELLLTEQVELLLTEEDRFRPMAASEADELVLDDILAELGPESRVVRLFDRAAMPTPGQLNDRIERHLRGAPSQQAQRPQPADASEALHEALAELRRSLG
jgi:hypothetical protein